MFGAWDVSGLGISGCRKFVPSLSQFPFVM